MPPIPLRGGDFNHLKASGLLDGVLCDSDTREKVECNSRTAEEEPADGKKALFDVTVNIDADSLKTFAGNIRSAKAALQKIEGGTRAYFWDKDGNPKTPDDRYYLEKNPKNDALLKAFLGEEYAPPPQPQGAEAAAEAETPAEEASPPDEPLPDNSYRLKKVDEDVLSNPENYSLYPLLVKKGDDSVTKYYINEDEDKKNRVADLKDFKFPKGYELPTPSQLFDFISKETGPTKIPQGAGKPELKYLINADYFHVWENEKRVIPVLAVPRFQAICDSSAHMERTQTIIVGYVEFDFPVPPENETEFFGLASLIPGEVCVASTETVNGEERHRFNLKVNSDSVQTTIDATKKARELKAKGEKPSKPADRPLTEEEMAVIRAYTLIEDWSDDDIDAFQAALVPLKKRIASLNRYGKDPEEAPQLSVKAGLIFLTLLAVAGYGTKKLIDWDMLEGAKQYIKKAAGIIPPYLEDWKPRAATFPPYDSSMGNREQVIGMITERLAKPQEQGVSRSLLLLAESAQGKTAMMKEIARRIAVRAQNLHSGLKGTVFFGLDAEEMAADTKYLGTWERKIKDFKGFYRVHPEAVYYVDEMIKILGMGEVQSEKEGRKDLINRTKEDMGDGILRLVLSTTKDEFNRYVVTYDPSGAFIRRLLIITLDNYTPEEAKTILRNISDALLPKDGIIDIDKGGLDALIDRLQEPQVGTAENLLVDVGKNLFIDAATALRRRIREGDPAITEKMDPEVVKLIAEREKLALEIQVSRDLKSQRAFFNFPVRSWHGAALIKMKRRYNAVERRLSALAKDPKKRVTLTAEMMLKEEETRRTLAGTKAAESLVEEAKRLKNEALKGIAKLKLSLGEDIHAVLDTDVDRPRNGEKGWEVKLRLQRLVDELKGIDKVLGEGKDPYGRPVGKDGVQKQIARVTDLIRAGGYDSAIDNPPPDVPPDAPTAGEAELELDPEPDDERTKPNDRPSEAEPKTESPPPRPAGDSASAPAGVEAPPAPAPAPAPASAAEVMTDVKLDEVYLNRLREVAVMVATGKSGDELREDVERLKARFQTDRLNPSQESMVCVAMITEGSTKLSSGSTDKLEGWQLLYTIGETESGGEPDQRGGPEQPTGEGKVVKADTAREPPALTRLRTAAIMLATGKTGDELTAEAERLRANLSPRMNPHKETAVYVRMIVHREEILEALAKALTGDTGRATRDSHSPAPSAIFDAKDNIDKAFSEGKLTNFSEATVMVLTGKSGEELREEAERLRAGLKAQGLSNVEEGMAYQWMITSGTMEISPERIRRIKENAGHLPEVLAEGDGERRDKLIEALVFGEEGGVVDHETVTAEQVLTRHREAAVMLMTDMTGDALRREAELYRQYLYESGHVRDEVGEGTIYLRMIIDYKAVREEVRKRGGYTPFDNLDAGERPLLPKETVNSLRDAAMILTKLTAEELDSKLGKLGVSTLSQEAGAYMCMIGDATPGDNADVRFVDGLRDAAFMLITNLSRDELVRGVGSTDVKQLVQAVEGSIQQQGLDIEGRAIRYNKLIRDREAFSAIFREVEAGKGVSAEGPPSPAAQAESPPPPAPDSTTPPAATADSEFFETVEGGKKATRILRVSGPESLEPMGSSGMMEGAPNVANLLAAYSVEVTRDNPRVAAVMNLPADPTRPTIGKSITKVLSVSPGDEFTRKAAMHTLWTVFNEAAILGGEAGWKMPISLGDGKWRIIYIGKMEDETGVVFETADGSKRVSLKMLPDATVPDVKNPHVLVQEFVEGASVQQYMTWNGKEIVDAGRVPPQLSPPSRRRGDGGGGLEPEDAPAWEEWLRPEEGSQEPGEGNEGRKDERTKGRSKSDPRSTIHDPQIIPGLRGVAYESARDGAMIAGLEVMWHYLGVRLDERYRMPIDLSLIYGGGKMLGAGGIMAHSPTVAGLAEGFLPMLPTAILGGGAAHLGLNKAAESFDVDWLQPGQLANKLGTGLGAAVGGGMPFYIASRVPALANSPFMGYAMKGLGTLGGAIIAHEYVGKAIDATADAVGFDKDFTGRSLVQGAGSLTAGYGLQKATVAAGRAATQTGARIISSTAAQAVKQTVIQGSRQMAASAAQMAERVVIQGGQRLAVSAGRAALQVGARVAASGAATVAVETAAVGAVVTMAVAAPVAVYLNETSTDQELGTARKQDDAWGRFLNGDDFFDGVGDAVFGTD